MKYLFLILLAGTQLPALAQQPTSPLLESYTEHLNHLDQSEYGLDWTQLGPTINSARAEAVQIDTRNPGTMYLAFGSGGLWKTTNNGMNWHPIFQDMPSLGIGDFALAPSNSDIIYLGTGESLKKPRNFTMTGTGMYKSDDAGTTWQHIGLDDSWHIGEVVVHPTNPNIVFVAVQGHFWSTNQNRGVYRTTDGGATWEHVLYVDERTGANDIVIAPDNPNMIYASMWENNPGVSGANSGVYVSNDGGTSWTRCENGLPSNENVGRIGLAVSYQNSLKAYAFVDHRNKPEGEGAAEIYRTTNGGLTWAKTHDHELYFLSVIGWYFVDIYVSPKNDDEIFALGVRLAHSTDGGENFEFIAGDVTHMFPSVTDPLHLDHCELWINPDNPDHLALCNDGGLHTSYDKGKTWFHYNNIPTGEFYDISLDYGNPYTIYGGTQDNSTVYGPASELSPDFYDGWKYLWTDPWSGGDGCITAIDPVDSNTIYFSAQEGAIFRLNKATGQLDGTRPNVNRDSIGLEYNFISPYFISPHDHKTLYLGGNYVFRSTDRGDNWEIISPNLTIVDDVDQQALALGAVNESPLSKGVLFAGSDRGDFWLSSDDGASWEYRSEGLPRKYIRCITPSVYDEQRLYVTMSGINYDDLGASVYVSDDLGKSWKSIAANLPDHEVYVLKEDPLFEDILYAGTFRGVYISNDRGKTWQAFGRGMPMTAVADIEIDFNTLDLIAGTHGRGMYKINIAPLHEFANSSDRSPKLFQTAAATPPPFRWAMNGTDYRQLKKTIFSYWLDKPERVLLEINNAEGDIIWSRSIDSHRGFNSYAWDLVTKVNESDQPYFVHYEEFIKPGDYTLTLKVNSQEFSNSLTVLSPD